MKVILEGVHPTQVLAETSRVFMALEASNPDVHVDLNTTSKSIEIAVDGNIVFNAIRIGHLAETQKLGWRLQGDERVRKILFGSTDDLCYGT